MYLRTYKSETKVADGAIPSPPCPRQDREIRRKKNVLYQKNEQVAKANMGDIQSKKDELSEKLAYEQGKLKDKSKDLKDLEKQVQTATKEHDAIVKQLNKSKDEFTSFERKVQSSLSFPALKFRPDSFAYTHPLHPSDPAPLCRPGHPTPGAAQIRQS